jgi:hypothetical protein
MTLPVGEERNVKKIRREVERVGGVIRNTAGKIPFFNTVLSRSILAAATHLGTLILALPPIDDNHIQAVMRCASTLMKVCSPRSSSRPMPSFGKPCRAPRMPISAANRSLTARAPNTLCLPQEWTHLAVSSLYNPSSCGRHWLCPLLVCRWGCIASALHLGAGRLGG